MANHTNQVFIVTVDDMWVKGDAFYPGTTENIKDATRLTLINDAKKYVKTASKRLKGVKGNLQIVKAMETRDENFNLVNVEVVKGE